MKFAPTNKLDKFSMFIDLQKFKKNLCLKKYFLKNPIERNETIHLYTHTNLKEKSTFFPKSMISSEITTFEQMVLSDLEKMEHKKSRDNLTHQERKALRELMQDNDIVIKPADKGGGIVIMTADYYNNEAMRILGDATTYRHLKKDPSMDFKHIFHDYLDQGHLLGILNNNELKYLKIDHPKIPIFYFLPKIHKNLENPPGRPIISGIGSISSRLSEYLDKQLQPYVTTTETYLKDTIEMINILTDADWKDGDILVTSDVQSLYTIIPHNRGIEAAQFFLEKDNKLLPEQVDFILKGIHLILEHNYFWFLEEFYLQISGTSMGTRFAPSFANLFMAHWENSFLSNWSTNLVFYRRYIDDIFFIWRGGEEALQLFLDFLATNDRGIILTSNWSKTEVIFLDLKIFVENDTIKTKTHFKDVDCNSFIERRSCHLPQWLNAVPKGQFLRMKRNCTNISDFDIQSTKLRSDCAEKGYNIQTLEDTRAEVRQMERLDLLKKKKKNPILNPMESIPFIFSYNPLNKDIRRSIKKHWPILQKDPILGGILPAIQRIICRGVKNLKMELTHKVRNKKTINHFGLQAGFHQCGNCLNCRNTKSKKQITSVIERNGKPTKLKGIMTCFSKNVIYVLTCPCGLKYVGRTTRPLNIRIQEHIRNIKKGFDKHSVSLQFKLKHGQNPEGLQFMAVQKLEPFWRGGSLETRLGKEEMRWIFLMNTLQPHGLNADFELCHFLND
uniref:Reverse transcriptase domain-containing protein n=1 Tax=Leptobrachium leishanense TaxID=445787 RepID=A0A8C5PUJ4_9ANUR